MNGKPIDFHELLGLYRRTLLEDVIPFWTKYAIDPNGGINTCIQDNGEVVSRDRWNWSQWRALWVFSKLYNAIEPREEWLQIARGIYNFQTKHGPLEDGHWPLLLDGDGNIKKGFESIYGDGFAIYGLVEFFRADGLPQALELAKRTFNAAESVFAAGGPPPAEPYPIPEGRLNHGISMLFSLAHHELALTCGEQCVHEAADRHHHKVMDRFLCKERGLVIEWLTLDGKEIPPPEGTVVIPGHGIESMWFQIHIGREKNDQATVDRAVAAIKRHLETGWDAEYGGLAWAVDADGRDEVGWRQPDIKLWWPHTEALYATLLAYECSGDQEFLDWHEKVRDYAFRHYPNREYGEWTQKLDRYGTPFSDVVALPVKDPFHLPRALIYSIEVLERLLGNV